ncbi:Hypothetical predicted protein [Prunus dulcis]|uniref:Uncharacterized protein n=1 Tax=Prunus dulcis TaxID=3755 RepID=A0A5E4G046_PRUDU|nr:Hypothetical predicted protein [Prunus dulcis]
MENPKIDRARVRVLRFRFPSQKEREANRKQEGVSRVARSSPLTYMQSLYPVTVGSNPTDEKKSNLTVETVSSCCVLVGSLERICFFSKNGN